MLIGGAELLVRGASRLARAAGISPLVVGLTIVAFGTSSPELAVTIGAAWSGRAEVALGNVVGSNILNVLLILGLSAAVAPLAVSRQLVRLDVPLVIGASLLVLVLGLDGRIGRWDGLGLFASVVIYTSVLVWRSRQKPSGRAEPEAPSPGRDRRRWVRDALFTGIGLALLVVGAQWLVDAAVTTAKALRMSELVIGLTIVAAGTSLPEVATSVVASLRGERDIAVGNVVGSNLFNLLAVLGAGSAVSPEGIPVPPGALTFDIPVMIAVAVAMLPVFFTGYTIARWEGLMFLGYYVAYTIYLILDATDHAAVPALRTAMTAFVLPLTAVTLVVLAARALRRGSGGAER